MSRNFEGRGITSAKGLRQQRKLLREMTREDAAGSRQHAAFWTLQRRPRRAPADERPCPIVLFTVFLNATLVTVIKVAPHGVRT